MQASKDVKVPPVEESASRLVVLQARASLPQELRLPQQERSVELVPALWERRVPVLPLQASPLGQLRAREQRAPQSAVAWRPRVSQQRAPGLARTAERPPKVRLLGRQRGASLPPSPQLPSRPCPLWP